MKPTSGVILFLSVMFALGSWHGAQAQASAFPDDLQYGDTSGEVHDLQSFLNNAHSFPIAESGAGSPGNETDYFGLLTKNALIKFQSAYGLPATGFFGPLTRAAMQTILGQGASPSASNATSTNSSSSTTSGWLAFFNEHAPSGMIPGFGGGNGEVSVSQKSTPDTTPPSVSLTAPTDGSTLAGIIALTASASDDVGIASVQFAIDGSATGTAITSEPYSFNWNSSALADGSHTITAIARDAAGNQTTSASVDITVENTAPDNDSISANQTDDLTDMTITWTTDELADSKVVYGTDDGGPYGTASSSPSLVTSHSIVLPGVSAAGNYYYEVVSTNAAGVTATSTQQEFIILPVNPAA